MGFVSVLLSLGYLLFGLSSGALFHLEDPTRYSPQRQAQLVQTVEFVGTFCAASLLILVACSLLRAPDDVYILGSVIGAGLLSGLGLPIFIGYQARLAPWGHNEATEFLVRLFAQTGALIGAALLLTLLSRAFRQIQARSSGTARAQASPFHPAGPGSRRPTAFSPCWHLPYCRDFLLSLCPAFQARIRCWKYGRGCFCDQNMNGFLVAKAESLPPGSEQEALQEEIAERALVVSQEWRGNRPPCPRCPIFLEHQRLKQKFLTPWILLLTALLLGMGRGWLQKGYGPLAKRAIQGWGQLSFTEDVAAPAAGREAAALATHPIGFYVVLVLVGILLFLVLLRLTERALFKWHL